MRLAMVVHAYYPHDVRVRRQVEALADRGDTVDIVCLRNEGERPVEQVGNANVHRLPVQHRRGQGVGGYLREYATFFVLAALELTRLFIRHRYRVVQIHNMPDFLVFTALVPKCLGSRVILDMHDVTPELFQSLYGIDQQSFAFRLLTLFEQASLAFADHVLTVNRNIRDLFLTRNPIAHKIEVVMNAPDPRYFKRREFGSRSSNGSFRLFHHGQILRRYNFEAALEGVRLASHSIPDVELDIYGDGEEAYIEEIKSRAATMGLQNRVHFHDRVPVEQVPRLISQADVGIVPCRKDVFVDTVMLPVRLLEYVAMGLPSVVSRVGTVESYFDDTQVGYYRHDSPVELSEKIVELYENRRLGEDRAREALRAFKGFDWPAMVARYYRVVDGAKQDA